MSVAKLRELKRLFQIIKTPSVIFLRKNDSPLKDEAEARIEFYILPLPLDLPTQKINYTKPQNNVKIYNNA